MEAGPEPIASSPDPRPETGPSPRFTIDRRLRASRRLAAYDRIAEDRARFIEKNAYYAREVERLVKSLVASGSRVLEVGCGLGDLIASLDACHAVGIDVSPRMVELARARHPGLDVRVCDVEADPLPRGPFDYIVLSDVVGHLEDVQQALEALRPLLAHDGRLVVTYYNFLWEPVLKLAERMGRKTPWPSQNWLSMHDIANLLRLAGFDVMRQGTDVLLPVDVPVVSRFMNRWMARLPGASHLALVEYFVARPVPEALPRSLPSVSVICPCRNERGNIREAVERTPLMGERTELIFVDGSSTDGTVQEIEEAIQSYPGPLQLRLVHQGGGKGKGDAVRKGFAAATGEVLMILDADLTVPPEELPKFYRALVTGKGDLVNGVRLVYPMEDEAMRFLNLLGNKFFGLALSHVIEQPIKDSLCGTKVLSRKHYDRIAANRHVFGDFDPFGDFDLLFGAARLNLKIVDLPVRYRARTYGDTKISRFRHGWLLLRMTAFGLRRFRAS
jgi:SAM-dependent methyltransferase